MSFVLVLILVMLIGDLGWWRWGHVRLSKVSRAKTWRRALGAFMAMQLGSLLLVISGRFIGDRIEHWIPRTLLTDVFLWHFIFLPLALLTVGFVELGRLAHHFINRDQGQLTPGPSGPGPTRRDFLRTATIAGPPIVSILTSGIALSQLNNFRVREFHLKLPQLPADLNGLTLAHVSDIHVGNFTNGPVLKKLVESVNAMHADLVLYSGDLINFSLTDLPNALDIIKQLDGRYGTYMCEGNHDLIEDRFAFTQSVRASGVPLLSNESTVLKIRDRDLQLLGLRWSRGDAGIEQSMNELLPQMRPDAFPILMAHHPHAFDRAAAADIPLTLSGHTHGGQIMASPNLGFGPFMFRYWSGLYEKLNSKLIVSNGVGNWFPLRINAPAEIAKITLHRA